MASQCQQAAQPRVCCATHLRIMKSLAAPKLMLAMVGVGPYTASLSECQDRWSEPSLQVVVRRMCEVLCYRATACLVADTRSLCGGWAMAEQVCMMEVQVRDVGCHVHSTSQGMQMPLTC